MNRPYFVRGQHTGSGAPKNLTETHGRRWQMECKEEGVSVNTLTLQNVYSDARELAQMTKRAVWGERK
jgi:hypothetical protein